AFSDGHEGGFSSAEEIPKGAAHASSGASTSARRRAEKEELEALLMKQSADAAQAMQTSWLRRFFFMVVVNETSPVIGDGEDILADVDLASSEWYAVRWFRVAHDAHNVILMERLDQIFEASRVFLASLQPLLANADHRQALAASGRPMLVILASILR